IVRQGWRRLVDRLDGADPAEAAARGGEEIALPPLVNAGCRSGELDLDDVLQVRMLAVGQYPDGRHVAAGPDDPFTGEKAERQFALVTRCPHHRRQRRPAQSDFARLLCSGPSLARSTRLRT